MAEAQLTELTELSPVPQGFIARVADCTFFRYLEQFAITVLGLSDVQYDHAVNDAEHDSWKSCYNVLRIWYNRTAPTVRDLRTMLKEAEARGLVNKGTHDLVLNGTQPAYLTSGIESGQRTSYPNLASILRSWYKDPMWQNLNLFPWMGDEWALRLSEVYTRLEMETFTGKLNQKETKFLGDYQELFADTQPEGTRIVLKGDPGIGKTTLTHKIAYDWATGNLHQFDLVLVLKLKFSRKHQTIENMVSEQLQSISDTPVSQTAVHHYLKSGNDRVLLVLDGLDEIKLKEYPHVQKILRGEAYRKCCILATTRPHVAETLHNKATSVAKILGFSREKAEEFASHIILDESEIKRFFKQMDERGMSEMASVPILVQALALLYRENKQLPENYKTTYDELVLYLRKTCEESKGLTEDEIKEAMDEISKLAFKGLTGDDRQLVFSREEIKNENIMKLGLLAAEKSGSGFRPTTVLYFLHTTLQEYCAADHVTRGLGNGNRRPWEMLVQDLQKVQTEIVHTLKESAEDLESRKEAAAGLGNTSSKEPKLQQKKTKPTVRVRTNQVGVVDSLTRIIEPRHALSVDQFSETMSVTGKIHPRFMKNESPHMHASLLRKMKSLIIKNDLWLSFTGYFKRISAILKLLEKLSEPLFIFIMGKLPLYSLELITAEITELILAASFEEKTGSMLYLHNIREGIEEYIKGKRPQSESTAIDGILMKNPALIDFTAPFEGGYSHLETVTRQPNFAALRITGTGAEDDSDFLCNVNHILKTTRNIHSAELEELSLIEDGDIRSEFVDTLCQSPIECIELFDLDHLVTKALLEKLPESVRYLSISQGCNDNSQTEPFRLLPMENLRMLSLENCVIDLTEAAFSNLRQLIIDRFSVAPGNNAVDLVEAMSRMLKLEYLGMYHCGPSSPGPSVVKLLQQSTLKHVILYDCNLSVDEGEQILESIRDGKLDHIRSLRLIGHKSLRGLEQRLQELCRERHIKYHISAETLFDIDNLICTNKLFKPVNECEPLEPNEEYQQGDDHVTYLKKLFTHSIEIQVKQFHRGYMTAVSNITLEQIQTAMTLLSNMTPEQIQAVMTVTSNTTPEQMQAVMTEFPNMTPEQIQAVMTGFPNMTPEQIQAVMTEFPNITAELMQAGMTGFPNVTQEQIQAVLTRLSNITPEQIQAEMAEISNMTPEQIQAVGTSNMTPEQMQAAMTAVSNITPEQIQAVMTEFPSITPEQIQTVMTLLSNTTPEQIQPAMTGFSNITPEQIQAGMTGLSNTTPEQIQPVMTGFSNITPELIQAGMTAFSNITPEQIQAMSTRVSNITPEQIQAGMTAFSNMTPEQIQAEMTEISNMTPEQIQAVGTSNMTPEQIQAEMTEISNMTPEQIQAGMTGFSDATPQQIQAKMTGLFNATPEQRQTMTTDHNTADSKKSLCASGATGTDTFVHGEPPGNETAQTTGVFENPPSCRERLETQANDARQPRFDFRTIRNLLPGICNTYNLANQAEMRRPRERSQQDNGQSHGERDDYLDDLDLD